MKIDYRENNTKIYNSYELSNIGISAIVDSIIHVRKNVKRIKVTRTKQSYINEIKAHNRLYKLGLFRNHTRDADLEEPIEKWKEILYAILSI